MHSAAIPSFLPSIKLCARRNACNNLDSDHSCSFQRPGARTLGPAKISKTTIKFRGDALCGCSDILVVDRTSLFSSSPLYLPGASGSSKVFLTGRVAAICAGGQSCPCRRIGFLSQSVLCIGSKNQGGVPAFRGNRRVHEDYFFPRNQSLTSDSFNRIGIIYFALDGFGFCTNKLRNRGRKSRPIASATFCTPAVFSVLRVGGGLGGTMELFKPQLVERMPFQFLSEYHATPRVAPAAAARRDSMNPVCFFGLGQQSRPDVEIVQAGDPVLREPAAEVRKEEIGSARIEKIINDMVATMRNAPGVGLAAPQIGIPLQIIVLEDTKEYMRSLAQEECDELQRYPFGLLVIVNPKLKVKSGSGRAVFFEGCLSVNGYRALVERHLEVEVTGLGRDGRPLSVQASGWKARILQHECDHLAGTLYVDKMISRSLRTPDKMKLPLPSGCPKPGVSKPSSKGFAK